MSKLKKTDMAKETVAFLSDKFRLKGDLHLPERSRPPVVIGAHGLFADRGSPKQQALARACVSAGISYFRFDHRGCGESQGDFSQQVSFEGRCRDLMNACEVIRERKDTGDRIALLGSSLGGAAALYAASEIEVESLVTFAAPLDSGCVLEALASSGQSWEIDPAGIIELLEFDLSNRLSSIENILIIHGESDEIVPVSHAYRIYEGVSAPKEIIVQENGDHLMSRESHQDAFIGVCVEWFKKSATMGFRTYPQKTSDLVD